MTSSPSSSNWMPPAPREARSTLRSSRMSHFFFASSVNRALTSASSFRSSAPERASTVTSTPNDENTCANSADTKPLPMITSRRGSSSIRITVSLVW
jgi:hypothetical protein